MKNSLQLLFFCFLHNNKVGLLGACIFIGLSAPAWATGTTPTHAPTVLTVSVSATPICAGAKTDLTASGCPANGSIHWATKQTGATITVSPQQTTTYTAICDVTTTSVVTTTAISSTATSSSATSTTSLITTVTTTTASGTVQVYPPIVLSPTSLSTLCNGSKDGQVTINATGGTGALQYQFNGQDFQTKNNTFGNLTGGVYPVGVKDAVGCIVQTTVVVTQPQALSVSIGPVSTKCVGGSDGAFLAIASGGVGDYRFILNNGTPQTSGVFLNLKADTAYSLTVADKNICVLYRTVIVPQPTPFNIKLTMKPALCAGSADGSVTVAATGGTGTYQYQMGTGAFQTGAQFTGLAANTYNVTVQDGNGCQGKQTVAVAQPVPLQLTAAAGPVNCFGPTSGSIMITPTGGTGTVNYQLTTGKTPQTSNVFTGVVVGNYTVVGTDANGCTSLVSVAVGQSEILKIQAVSIAATCCICPTGAVKLTSTGGTGTTRQYQLIGQAYQPDSRISGLRPNTYRFRVTDEVGCADSIVAVVTDGAALTLSVGKITNVSCTGGQNGEATVQVAGGTKPFAYYWATERRDTLKPFVATQAALSEGTYTVSVVDSNRCSTTTVFVTLKAQYPVPFKPAITQTGSSTLLVVDLPTGIQWYVRTGSDPGKPVPNATDLALVPFQSGQYYVISTVNGCASPPSDVINFVLTAFEDASSLSVKVVPNPIIDRLRVEVEQAERSVVTVQLLDGSGRAVMAGQIPAFTGKKQAEWPLSGVATGAYLLKVNADTRQSILRVLVE